MMAIWTKKIIFLITIIIAPLCLAKSHTPQQSLAPMLAKISPAVVNISVIGTVPNQITSPTQADQTPGKPNDKLFHAVGSGVIIDAKKGYIITNYHVVNKASTVNIALNDGRQFKAKKIGLDPATDIAVLQIPAHNLKQISIGNANTLQVGDFVTAIGNPFGLHQSVTSGVISALHRDDLHIESFEDFIQTDAPINPGNSGGALVNSAGELIGINTAIFAGPQNIGNIGIGFAIPVNMAMGAAKQLIKHGKVNRGLLGIMIQKVSPALASTLHLPNTKGALVSDIMPNSPADQAGIKSQDFITAVNKKPIRTSSQLRNIAGMMPIGTKVHITLIRQGKTHHKKLTIADPNKIANKSSQKSNLLAGVQLRRIDGISVKGKTIQGVGVDIVEPNSLAWMNGLRNGDVILAINQQKIKNIEQINAITKKSTQQMLLKVFRINGTYFLAIQNPG